MSQYTLNTNSSNFIQTDGSTLLNDSTKYDGGTLRKGGNIGQLNNRFRARKINDGAPDNENMTKYDLRIPHQTRMGNAVQNANLTNAGVNTAIESITITVQDGQIRVDAAGAITILVGDAVAITNMANDVLDSTYRVISISGTGPYVYILNGKFPNIGPGPWPADIGKTAMSDTRQPNGSPLQGFLRPERRRGYNNVRPGQYSIRKVVNSHLHSFEPFGTSPISDQLSSGASDFGQRNKVHSRMPRYASDRIYILIRNGDWNPYTGFWAFNREPKRFANFTENFGQDDETVEHLPNNRSVGGEFAYRYGITVQENHGI